MMKKTDWRLQRRHLRQFERSPYEARDLGIKIDDDQMIAFHNQHGYAYTPVPLDNPSLDMDGICIDAAGRDIMIPWPFAYQAGEWDLYSQLDEDYEGWREWPALTGWTQPMMGCWCCDMYNGDDCVLAVPLWESMLIPGVDDSQLLSTCVNDWIVKSNYNAWFHYYVDQAYDGGEFVPEPTEPLNLGQLVLPDHLQTKWDRVLELQEVNRLPARQHEYDEFKRRGNKPKSYAHLRRLAG